MRSAEGSALAALTDYCLRQELLPTTTLSLGTGSCAEVFEKEKKRRDLAFEGAPGDDVFERESGAYELRRLRVTPGNDEVLSEHSLPFAGAGADGSVWVSSHHPAGVCM